MTAVVETSEDDATLAVARFTAEMAWADAGPEVAEPQVMRCCDEAQTFMVEGRWSDLASLLLTSADLIFSSSSEKDLDCIFTVICNLVTKAQTPDEALAMAEQIATKVTQQPNDKPALRLRILFNLYNMLDNRYSKFLVYKRALKLAANGKIADLIIPSFKKMDIFLKEWNIAKSDQRELFITISNILKDNKGSAKDSYSFLIKYLATFDGEDAYSMGEAKEEAVRAIIEFVKAPDMFQCDLLDMAAVAQLEKDGKYALVYRLLQIFLTQRLDAYLEFEATNSALLKSYGIVRDDCITKMRLMSFADLASKGSGEISYSSVRDTLRVTDDEVEFWIVRATSAKLVDCKMDQMRQVAVVSRSTERVFGPAQWNELHSRLSLWKDNITNIIRNIQKVNAAPEQVPEAMQGVAVQ
ncbi:uncharacterized protein LOC131039415 [Cryptomeria japonica]|uniref:uncharacterized protein LOC131039415 n=1 Tax=Cryptomeria japonica TaxID=3369 RepID=UPI0027DA9502|nr:uncharacterized protein LOC131039415 [Cryptomeria japonica]XP_057828151.2 uncharacterized protein LOC131039415 [Cryptomeria japonica]